MNSTENYNSSSCNLKNCISMEILTRVCVCCNIYQNKYAYALAVLRIRLSGVVLLTVYRYAEYRFVLVEKTKSAKNIWEPVFEDVIILGFLMADTSSKQQNIYIFCKICHIFTLY